MCRRRKEPVLFGSRTAVEPDRTIPKGKNQWRENTIKIAVISSPFIECPPQNYGGLELVAWNLACGLAEKGHKVVLFATTSSQVPKNGLLVEFGNPIKTVHSDWLKAETSAYDYYGKILLENDFDIIIGHNWFGMEYRAKVMKPQLKVCHTHHGGLSPEWWAKSKPPFKLNLIAISQWMQTVYRIQGFESRVCYNGINMTDYKFNPIRGTRLLFVGRIDTFKQPEMAINVAKKLSMGLDIVGGTFVQDPNYLNYIKSLCDGKQIKFYADASQEKKIELLQNCRCVLFTSKMGEPFGLVPIEAFACGSPVVSTIDGATPETVKPDVGFLCKDEDEMVEAVNKVGNIDPKRCRVWAENFTHVKMTERYLERFQQILSNDEW